MRRSLPVLAILLLTSPAFAQDVDFGAFGDPGSLLTPTAPVARGAAPARGAAAPVAPPDRLVRLREALVKAEASLTKEQETDLNKLLDAEIPVMRQTIQTHGRQMLAARAASNPAPPTPSAAPQPAPAPPAVPPPARTTAERGASATGGPLPPAPAARGIPPSARVPADILDALEVEMRQMNDALFTKIASSPALNENQQSILTKMARSQIRSRGGFEALRISLEDAGAPLTAEQLPKVRALFEEQKDARAALARESQGTPDQTKLKQLDRETLTKVVGLLVPAQRTALLTLLRAQQ